MACVISWCLVYPGISWPPRVSKWMNHGMDISLLLPLWTIKIKAMKMFVVRMSRFCIAISICDCLPQTRWYFLLPGVWYWTLEWILMYLQETQGLLPGQFKILSNGKQNSGQEYSAIVFSVCVDICVPFNGKRLRGPAMVTRGGLKSWSTSFGRNIPTSETDLLFEDLLLPKIFTWRKLQVLLDH